MSDATKLPPLSVLTYFQWSRKGAPAPTLDAPIDDDDTTLHFSAPALDEAGAVITEGFLMGIRKSNGWVETCYVAAGKLSADGYSATDVVRGVDPAGIDYTTGAAGFADSHEQGEPIFCSIPAQIPSLLVDAMQGVIATGGANFLIGTDAAGTVTVKRSTGAGTSVGFLRWYTTTSQAQYSNDGTSWINFDDSIASALAKVSANDTTAGYLNGKLVAGTGVTFTENNDGGNETLSINATAGNTVVEPSTYTPAYLTGANGAQSAFNNWLAVLDGSFAITLDGVALSVTGIDFTGVTSMADVATYIQTALRAESGTLETVAWDTDHFIITSADTTSSSAITVTSAAGAGTDISGAGANDWMDCDVGNGAVTNAVLDQTADAGKLVEVDATGLIDNLLIPWSDATTPSLISEFTTGEAIDGTGTPVAVYLKASDSKVWKADSDATESCFKFVGFIVGNYGANVTADVITGGAVSGFAALTVGSDYYTNTSAGAISATPGTYSYKIGRAISTTKLLIEKGTKMITGTDALSTTTVGTVDTTITCGFRPKTITLDYYLQGHGKSAGTPHYYQQTGRMNYKDTTLIGYTIYGSQASLDIDGTDVVTMKMALAPMTSSTPPTIGDASGSGGSSITTSINSTSDTGFVIRKVVAAGDATAAMPVKSTVIYQAIGY